MHFLSLSPLRAHSLAPSLSLFLSLPKGSSARISPLLPTLTLSWFCALCVCVFSSSKFTLSLFLCVPSVSFHFFQLGSCHHSSDDNNNDDSGDISGSVGDHHHHHLKGTCAEGCSRASLPPTTCTLTDSLIVTFRTIAVFICSMEQTPDSCAHLCQMWISSQ